MAVLKNCCCCFTLRRGTVTLGVMGFTGSITAIISLALGLYFVEEVATIMIKFLAQFIDIPQSLGVGHLSQEDKDKEVQKLHNYLVNVYHGFVFVGAIIGTIIAAIISGLMVWGAVKSRRMFLLPWLILEAIVMVGTAVCIILCVVYVHISVGIIILIIGIIQLLVMIYFWLVVFSFYQELRDRERMEFNTTVEMRTRLTTGK